MKKTFFKKVTAAFLAAVMVVIMLPAMAFPIAAATEGTCGTDVTWVLNTRTRTLTVSGSGAMTDYTGSTKAPWYDSRTLINKLVIEDGVTSIGNYAFNYLSNLSSVTIPDSVTKIGNYAFQYCSILPSISIPSSVTSIGSYAFYNCAGLTGITLPDSVEFLGTYVFYDCDALTSVKLSNGLLAISSYAFYSCDALTSIVIPDGVTSIGSCAFAYCDKMSKVTISNTVGTIGDHAFYYIDSKLNITYCGTSSQWSIVSKGSYWSDYTSEVITYHPTCTLDEGVMRIEPSCISEGVKVYTCSECGIEKLEWFDILDGHGWGEGKVTVAPTHTTEGVKTYTCGCGETKTETLAKLEAHEWDEGTVTLEPTHTEEGVKTYTCTCGEIKTETVEKLDGHTWDDGVITVEPTHTEEGVKTYTCECGETKIEAVAVIPHSFGDWGSVDSEQHERACECGATEYAAHAWDAGNVTLYPTYTSEGEIEFACTECSATKIETLPAFEVGEDTPKIVIATTHVIKGDTVQLTVSLKNNPGIWGLVFELPIDANVFEFVSADLTDSIFRQFGICVYDEAEGVYKFNGLNSNSFSNITEDGTVLVITLKAKETAAAGTYDILVNIDDANTIDVNSNRVALVSVKGEVAVTDHECSFGAWELYDTNQHVRVCECGAKEYADHEWDDGVITTEPTHFTEGVITYTCVCETTKVGVAEKLAEHVWDEGSVTLEPTHLEKGIMLYSCDCGSTKFEDIDMLPDHEWDEGTVTTEPTHLEEGVKTFVCICGETKTEAVEKLPEHTFGDWSKMNSDSHARYCECGDKEIADHVWDEGNVSTAPTYVAEGVMTYACQECDATKLEAIPTLEVTATTPKFTVTGNTAMAGGTVKITVSIENNPGIWGTAFSLPIDTEVFEFVSADTNNSVFKQFGICGFDEAKGAYKFNGLNSSFNDITGDGTVVVITLKVKENVEAGEYKLSAKLNERDIINANGEVVSFASVEGTVTVIDYILGDVNGDTYITNADVLAIFRYIYNPELYPVNVIAADVNHDSYVTNADVLAIFRYIYNSELYPIG